MQATASSHRTITAYCWADGLIKFTRRAKVPAGALIIITGPERRVRNAIAATARHSYDGKSLIVSGVRDIHVGFSTGDKVDALTAYKCQVERRLAVTAR